MLEFSTKVCDLGVAYLVIIARRVGKVLKREEEKIYKAKDGTLGNLHVDVTVSSHLIVPKYSLSVKTPGDYFLRVTLL